MKKNFNRTELMRFTRNSCIALVIFGSIMLICHNKNYVWFYLAGLAVVLLYFAIPYLLNLIYLVVKKIVYLVGWAAGQLVLLLLFYIIFTPLGLAIRMFRVDLLERRIEKGKRSYWKEVKEGEFRSISYERQF